MLSLRVDTSEVAVTDEDTSSVFDFFPFVRFLFASRVRISLSAVASLRRKYILSLLEISTLGFLSSASHFLLDCRVGVATGICGTLDLCESTLETKSTAVRIGSSDLFFSDWTL